MPVKSERACTGCAGKAKRVEPVTLRALVREDAMARLSTGDGFRYCPARECDVVYSRAASGETVHVDEVTVEPFHKSDRPERLVCYCFGHTAADVVRDEERVILRDIEDKCKRGLDRCEVENPQGRCCLANVRNVYREAEGADGVHRKEEPMEDSTESCCAPSSMISEPAPRQAEDAAPRAGRWAAGGAIVAAVASSACCWLPLSLIALGVSAGGVGAFFEAYRYYFLAGTAGLLGLGFYLVYLRQPKCAPGDACAVPNPRLTRLNKILLWTATAFVLAFATFPNYVGMFLGGGEAPAARAATDAPAQAPVAVTRVYLVEGMSCEGCTVHIVEQVRKVSGVADVEVVYADKLARVTFAADANVDDARILAAIDEAGFEAKPQSAIEGPTP